MSSRRVRESHDKVSDDDSHHDDEANRLSGRARRYMRVGAGLGGVAARYAARRLTPKGDGRDQADAERLRQALGGLKGPLMKIAQLMSTIPDLLPAEYAQELSQLQSHAPPMGWPFVKRRMAAELGADWRERFASFSHEAVAAASLGQVHEAKTHDGRALACKLQYPDMQSAVEADLAQLAMVFRLYKHMDPVIDTSEIAREIAARLREELDYAREARHMALYACILKPERGIKVPDVVPELSTGRLLSMSWADGEPLLTFKDHSQTDRNFLVTALFKAWWQPFGRYGVIHGDPHLGNYTAITDGKGKPKGLNLLDFGCVRLFPPRFVAGVIDLYQGLMADDEARIVHAYEAWGFKGLTRELIDSLNIWARFIYGPMMEDRVRALADGVSPAEYGRAQAFQVHQALKRLGPVTVPREFVFMDRAAIGLGGVFLHLRAELNFYRLFNDAIEDFDIARLARRQARALKAEGLPVPQ